MGLSNYKHHRKSATSQRPEFVVGNVNTAYSELLNKHYSNSNALSWYDHSKTLFENLSGIIAEKYQLFREQQRIELSKLLSSRKSKELISSNKDVKALSDALQNDDSQLPINNAVRDVLKKKQYVILDLDGQLTQFNVLSNAYYGILSTYINHIKIALNQITVNGTDTDYSKRFESLQIQANTDIINSTYLQWFHGQRTLASQEKNINSILESDDNSIRLSYPSAGLNYLKDKYKLTQSQKYDRLDALLASAQKIIAEQFEVVDGTLLVDGSHAIDNAIAKETNTLNTTFHFYNGEMPNNNIQIVDVKLLLNTLLDLLNSGKPSDEIKTIELVEFFLQLKNYRQLHLLCSLIDLFNHRINQPADQFLEDIKTLSQNPEKCKKLQKKHKIFLKNLDEMVIFLNGEKEHQLFNVETEQFYKNKFKNADQFVQLLEGSKNNRDALYGEKKTLF